MTSPQIIEAQGATAHTDTGRGVRRFTKAQWIDLGVLLALLVIALLGFYAPFGSWMFLLSAGGGLLIGGGAALFAYRFRLNVLNSVLVAIAGYFIFGTLFALTGQGFLAVLPTLQTLWALARGAVFSWRDSVTISTPIESPDYMGVMPYMAAIIACLISWLLALRWLPHHRSSSLRAAVAALPALVVLLTTLLVGTPQPFFGLVRGILFAVLAIVWLGWRRGLDNVASAEARKGLERRRLTGTAILVGAAVAVTGILGFVTNPAIDGNRFVLREELTPPFDPYNYESPLAGFREYTKLLNDTTLFTVNGLQQGDKIRLAALDDYSGKKWQAPSPSDAGADSGAYSLVGRDVPRNDFITASQTRDIEVYINGYNDIWLPSIGSATSLDLTQGALAPRRSELRFNGKTGTGVLTGGLREGDSYRVSAQLQNVPLEGQLDNVPVADLELPEAEPAPAALVEAMQKFTAEETSPYLQLRAIEEAIKAQGYLSHGTASDQAPSRAGHGLDRMQELFDLTYMIGDQEQYASAMALMARELGYPSRVVVGFAPKSVTGASTEIRGSDVTAWVEVPFEGFGWVAFDPTPDQTDAPVNTSEQPQTKPRAQVRQPPQTEAQPDELITAADRPADDPQEDRGDWPLWAIVLVISLAVPIVLYCLPLLIFWLLRARRRRIRRSGSSDQQVAGAWDETIDRLAELGYAIPERETRPVVAKSLHPELVPVAHMADRAVFGGEELPETEAAAVWEESQRIIRQAGLDAKPWRRQLAKFRVNRRSGGIAGEIRRTREGRMTPERAELRNRVIRSRGADLPDYEAVARVEGVSPVAVPVQPGGVAPYEEPTGEEHQ